MKNGRYEENGEIRWYLNDLLHKEGSPAIEKASGSREWYQHGLKHRKEGPAIDNIDGGQEWWLNGVLHCETGPAMNLFNDQIYHVLNKNNKYKSSNKEWYLHGVKYTEEEFNQWLDKKNLNKKLQHTLIQKPKDKTNKI